MRLVLQHHLIAHLFVLSHLLRCWVESPLPSSQLLEHVGLLRFSDLVVVRGLQNWGVNCSFLIWVGVVV